MVRECSWCNVNHLNLFYGSDRFYSHFKHELLKIKLLFQTQPTPVLFSWHKWPWTRSRGRGGVCRFPGGAGSMVVMAADDYSHCAPALSVSSCNSRKAKVKKGVYHIFRDGWWVNSAAIHWENCASQRQGRETMASAENLDFQGKYEK